MKMDVSKFKKVSSDGKKTVLKHPRGHEIVIAHDAVSPSTRKQLHALPGYASGGSVDDGSDSTPPQQFGPIRPNPTIMERVNNALSLPGEQEDEAQKQWEQGRTADEAKMASAIPQAQPAPAAPYSSSAEMPQEPDRSLAEVSPADTSMAPQEQPEAAAPEAQTEPPKSSIQASNINPADTQAAEQDKTAAQNYQKGFEDYHRENAQKLGAEDAAWQHDLQNGHVTPETYQSLFAKKDTLGKVGTLFGLLVSGMGSGLAHQSNAVMDAMNKEIENDFNAQRQSKDNAQNFLKLHQQQALNESTIKLQGKQGQLTEAESKKALAEANIQAQAAALMKANRTALHDQVLKVQAMPPGPMKSQAEAALALLSSSVDAKNSNIADMYAGKLAMANMITGGNAGGAPNTTFLKAVPGMEGVSSDIEQKMVPGFGQAAVPVPQETRQQLMAQKQYDQKAREYVNFAKQHANNWSNLNLAERQRVANQGGAMAANLQSLYRNKIKGGVYKKGEQEFIQQIIPDQPAKWSASFNAIPKVEQTIADNSNDMNTTASSVGLPVRQGQPQPGDHPQGAERTAVNKKTGERVVFRNGKWEPYNGR